MQIFRQDKIDLTPNDWKLIGTYLIIMCLWLGYRFYVEEVSFLRALAYLINSTVEVLFSFLLIRKIVEVFFLRTRQWLLGFILIVLGLFVIGAVGIAVAILTDGNQLSDMFYPFGAFVVNSVNNSLLDVALLIGFVFSKKSYDQLIANKDLAIENRENALKILRAQFSPHFLFNNLNTVDALIDDQPEVAKKYVAHLASLYRYLTRTTDQDVMALDDELKFIRDYLFLIKVRYGEDYLFDIQVQQETTNRYLPSGALQSVLENIVKHNAVDGKTIKTVVQVINEKVSVSNTKGIHAEEQTDGTGVRNLSKRYELLGAEPPTVYDLADRYEIELPLLQAD